MGYRMLAGLICLNALFISFGDGDETSDSITENVLNALLPTDP